jgi:hypothetical protein
MIESFASNRGPRMAVVVEHRAEVTAAEHPCAPAAVGSWEPDAEPLCCATRPARRMSKGDALRAMHQGVVLARSLTHHVVLCLDKLLLVQRVRVSIAKAVVTLSSRP